MKHKKTMCSLLALLMALANIPTADALVLGKSYRYNDYGESVPAPPAMFCDDVLDGADLGVSPLSGPEDLFVDEEGQLYIADTKNHRVVVLDANLRAARIIEEVQTQEGMERLRSPTGVFAKGDDLYICDTGNGRVIRVDTDNHIIQSFGMPVTDSLDPNMEFRPQKVEVDSTGNVYIVAYGIYQGLIEYDPHGEFVGFYGSNRIQTTLQVWFDRMWKAIFSQEQQEGLARLIPTEYSNLFIDPDDFVYTTTSVADGSVDEVKKLNALGSNVLNFQEYRALLPKNDYGDLESHYEKGVQIDSVMVDVQVDGDGVITLLDQTRGRLFQYDAECNPLFIYGSYGEQKGSFLRPTAVVKLGERYAVLDAAKGTITLLKYTDYALKVRQASACYAQGDYKRAKQLWTELLEENGGLSLANRGIGRALLQEERYGEAMQYFKSCNDRSNYSNALREYRREFIRNNLVWLIIGAACVLTTWLFVIRRLKAWFGFPPKMKRKHKTP